MTNTTRRDALRSIAGTAAAFPVLGQTPDHHHTNEDGNRPAYIIRFFTSEQIETLTALSETILPADEHSPGAAAARVYEYFDAIVADAPASVRTAWTSGVEAMNRVAAASHGNTFARCSPEQRHGILAELAANERKPKTPEERFFVIVKRATIDGYYTSSIGIHRELEYRGNTAVAEFPGCVHQTVREPAK